MCRVLFSLIDTKNKILENTYSNNILMCDIT